MVATCAGAILLLLLASPSRLRLQASPLLTCCEGCCTCARSDSQVRALEQNVIAILSNEQAGELLVGRVSRPALCSVAVRSVGEQERRRCACFAVLAVVCVARMVS